jgi:hypothetical protein
LGAGSVFFAAVKPPCKIGKTSEFVMLKELANPRPRRRPGKCCKFRVFAGFSWEE